MKLMGYGYTTEEVKRYEMNIESVIMTIARKLIAIKKTDIEIRIVDCFSGDVDRWAGVNGMLTHEWPSGWKVSLYDTKLMHDNKEDKDYLVVIISDNIEMMDDELTEVSE